MHSAHFYYDFSFLSGLYFLSDSLAPLAVAVEPRRIALCSVVEGEKERVEVLHGFDLKEKKRGGEKKKKKLIFSLSFVLSPLSLSRSLPSLRSNEFNLSRLLHKRRALPNKKAMRRAGAMLFSRAAASSSASAPCRWLLAGGRDAMIEASSSSATTTSTSTSSSLFSSSLQRRSFAIPCNLKLGAVPPPPLVVRYSKGGADAFIELADELEEAVPGLMVEGREEEEGESSSSSGKNVIVEVSAPGGQTLLSPAEGKPVLARDVLEALGKWQEEEEEWKKKKK